MKKIRYSNSTSWGRHMHLSSRYRSRVNQLLSWQDIFLLFDIEIEHITKYGTIIAICPTHDDHNPSLKVLGWKPHWIKCYSCGTGGDKVDFILELSGMSKARVQAKKKFIDRLLALCNSVPA